MLLTSIIYKIHPNINPIVMLIRNAVELRNWYNKNVVSKELITHIWLSYDEDV